MLLEKCNHWQVILESCHFPVPRLTHLGFQGHLCLEGLLLGAVPDLLNVGVDVITGGEGPHEVDLVAMRMFPVSWRQINLLC